jgi:DNA-binding FadR family transcriptional regulator
MTASTAASAVQKKHRNLAQNVIEGIVQQMRASQLAPGDKLPAESAIMKAYGVSRTVVREAISQLRASGLVQTQHGVGTFVCALPTPGFGIDLASILTMRDVLAVLELRISIETEAAWLAASRCSSEHATLLGVALTDLQLAAERGEETIEADVRFHTLVAHATRNSYFVDMFKQLGGVLIPRARLNTSLIESGPAVDYLDRVNREHEDIYHAILRGDADAARAAMHLHLSNSRERLRQAQRLYEPAAD